MVDWPTSLPQCFIAEGFAYESPDNLIASETSIGPAKVRRRTTSNVQKLSGTMVMDDTQLSTFRAFVSDDIKDRSLTFNFPDPFGGTSPLLVRMPNTYKISVFGLIWKVAFDLEILP
jgi:hypothetical protein